MNPFSESYSSDNIDKELIELILNGDKKALGILLKNHQAFIYNVAWKMTGNVADAEDLSQEAIIKIISNLGQFKFQGTFRAWAYRIVFNHFINEKRKSRYMFPTNFEDLGAHLASAPDNEMTLDEKEEKKELIREVRLQCLSGMLLCLTKEQRLVYIIGEIFGADHTIGSEILEMSKANFRMKLSKARKDLYNFMNNNCGLVNEANPCRCHKKVKTVVDFKMIDAKNLLHNRKEYVTFQSYVAESADFITDNAELKYIELQQNLSFKKDFDKKLFIEDILENKNWKSILNLN
ncbi:RNA polymerase sigma factor [Paucihalobacter sp.]|uniref:RNA polymerase sigma factor n=1 Tax=Paucihalobacter sp. TaxID=2850405 RepID=UPI003D160364